MGLGLGLAK